MRELFVFAHHGKETGWWPFRKWQPCSGSGKTAATVSEGNGFKYGFSTCGLCNNRIPVLPDHKYTVRTGITIQ